MQVHAIKIDEQGYLQFQRTENGHWFYAGCPFLTGQCGIHCQFLDIREHSVNDDEIIAEFQCKSNFPIIMCKKENFVNESGENI